mmetsp:Transcript_23960/g.43413  ORF Transcript_23960/g.43413 Transcript_23960/m.43413 type:complete len:548 (-) Transcript_23960:117-1760(-)|eukprot:CAMPEP_0197660562 /NCGR_PEP_ID=MMETSP1338-20131121/50916_1 /TAXON_ID=43686 ORGANISM="Pelagodinium beii, Strain RCC1491" /NCGR_SAMPLE_ID=MMETSP1338 /ASSEMBLY_ACC=CAM_ASM_000754 /LENGTH=547 /DNA_ID=CAMNT_0043237933 /DNA_START=71 /DNA_END=1714 /DNA_ORIENTATION=-
MGEIESQKLAETAQDDGLYWSGRFAGGIRADIARRLPWYKSDWVDGAKGGLKTLTASLYMFFACLAPGIAFGAFFDQHSGGQSGVVEYLVTQSVSGIIFAIISGQPLVILRPTGPITVFISQLYSISTSLGVPFLAAQAWTGIFVGSYMIIIAVTDTCAAIRQCSRFTQDMFGFFVSTIFIFMGTSNIVDKFVLKSDTYSSMHQLLLTITTLYFAIQLAGFGKTRYFNSKIREVTSDFAVPLAVIAGTLVANFFTVPLEPLPVPRDFEPTMSGRPWIVDICPADSCGMAVGIGACAAIPLVLLFFIDQNVTMLLTQHPDHKLKKGGAFHWNFFILGCFNIIFPLFGCPYVTGSLPHSPQFVKALATSQIVREGGHERSEVVSVSENRLAPLLVNVFVLVTLPTIGSLSIIPTSVICDALFLFMGLSGLPGNELFERLKLLFTEESLYPPMKWSVDEVPRSRMHVFTIIQFCFVGLLFGVSRSPIALAFPVFLVLSIPTRMLLHKLTGGYLTLAQVQILDHARPGNAKEEEIVPEILGAGQDRGKLEI